MCCGDVSPFLSYTPARDYGGVGAGLLLMCPSRILAFSIAYLSALHSAQPFNQATLLRHLPFPRSSPSKSCTPVPGVPIEPRIFLLPLSLLTIFLSSPSTSMHAPTLQTLSIAAAVTNSLVLLLEYAFRLRYEPVAVGWVDGIERRVLVRGLGAVCGWQGAELGL